jgi:hypothetical protein
MRESLFNQDTTYTADGMRIDGESSGIFTELFAEYVLKGYSPREIGHIIMMALVNTECRFCVREQFKDKSQ